MGQDVRDVAAVGHSGQSIEDGALTAREPTWRIIVRAAIPGATAAALAAVVIAAIAAPVLGLGFVGTVGFLAVAWLAAGTRQVRVLLPA